MKDEIRLLCKLFRSALAVVALSSSVVLAPVRAATITMVSGTIRQMDAVGGGAGAPGNADTRVYLNGITSFCPGAGDPSWAFINSNDANYKAVLATLMLAYATGKSVNIFSTATTITPGTFCQIVYVNVVG